MNAGKALERQSQNSVRSASRHRQEVAPADCSSLLSKNRSSFEKRVAMTRPPVHTSRWACARGAWCGYEQVLPWSPSWLCLWLKAGSFGLHRGRPRREEKAAGGCISRPLIALYSNALGIAICKTP